MRILILDDQEIRHETLSKQYIGCTIDHAYTAQEACNALYYNDKYDLIQLDHDLGDSYKFISPFDEYPLMEQLLNNGWTVAEYIARDLSRDKVPTTIIIHSWNPEGAKRMKSTLEDYNVKSECIPFRG